MKSRKYLKKKYKKTTDNNVYTVISPMRADYAYTGTLATIKRKKQNIPVKSNN